MPSVALGPRAIVVGAIASAERKESAQQLRHRPWERSDSREDVREDRIGEERRGEERRGSTLGEPPTLEHVDVAVAVVG
jgi:hypothetical protein